MSIRWQIHISTSLLLAIFMMSGRFAEYAIIMISLLIHECGHILAARLVGVKIESVCFYLHGADLRFTTSYIASKQQLFIASGGPVATILLLIVCLIKQEGILAEVIEMQKLILLVNLCPIWPLDGGRIVQAILTPCMQTVNGELLFLKFSFLISFTLFFGATLFLKPFLMLLSAVICKQIVDEIKQFPLRSAYKRLVLHDK